MLRALAVIALVACGPRAGAPAVIEPVAPRPAVPRLLAPPLIDPAVRGAGYLTAVALQLQPAWHQFLEDCRLRLPAEHALNRMTLATTADLEIDGKGQLVAVRIAPSGSRDFDHAIKDVLDDASPLPAPPRELWSDDDHVHLTWLFARDRRQAGPATAQVDDVELPLRGVVDKRIAENDLPRAARRILRAPPGDRDVATQRLMTAALRSSLAVSDSAVRRAAIDAIARAQLTELAPPVRQLLTSTTDIELRVAAMAASAALHDDVAAPILVDQLRADLNGQPRLPLAEARALVALGHDAEVKTILAAQNVTLPTAVQLLALAPVADAASKLQDWLASRDPRLRAATCTALAGYVATPTLTLPLIQRGLRDRDAIVRAACVASSHTDNPRAVEVTVMFNGLRKRLRELLRDRDAEVRLQAVRALAILEPDRVPDMTGDPAAEVRAAFARVPGANLHALVEDRDPDVRASAWTVLAVSRDKLAAHAAADSAAQVRRAAIPAIESEDLLLHLASSDDDAEVRTAALVELAGRRGRAASTELLLERLADAPPGSAERVRTALAWLLAR